MKKIGNYKWKIEKTGKMRVPGVIYASDKIKESMIEDNSINQVKNVAHLPGIQRYSLAMPDIHWGYGFPIGGVAAMDAEEGVISPGGVGYDINCGVRALTVDLHYSEVEKLKETLTNKIYSKVPCGVGSTGDIKISRSKLKKILKEGSSWAVRNGYGWDSDVENTEESGCIESADPEILSDRALDRGRPQLGTLGSGNHFIEIQRISDIYNEKAADTMGIMEDGVMVMIHTGSRGLGHQVCSDWVKNLQKTKSKYGIEIPDKQLICVPVDSPEGKHYLAAMGAAANFAWTNRQIILSRVREAFAETFSKSAESLGMSLIYDVAHNIAKFENHQINGVEKRVCVHRKGSTRAFPPGHPDVPEKYRKIGQPVIIPGDMGTASYILLGTDKAMNETFGSTCHGAGRVMSRKKAIKITGGRHVTNELKGKGIYVRSNSVKTVREEVPDAYKDIDEVISVVDSSGISKKVSRSVPLSVVKG